MNSANSINDLINALMDMEYQFPAKLLYQFSDLGSHEQKTLAKVWLDVPLQRRRTFLQDLAALAEIDPILMFENVARVALGDEDAQVQISAIDLLFDAEDCHLIPTYLRLLGDVDRDEVMRAAVANALGPYIFMGEIDKLPQEVQTKIEESLLQTYHNDKSDLVRRRSLEALGYSSREDIAPLLQQAAAMQDELWVESAMFAMGRSADDRWESFVIENLDHENLAIRIQAVHAAGELLLKKARRYLLREVDDAGDDTLRREMIWALAQIGGEGVERKFENLLALEEDEEEISFLEEALEILNFTEGDKSLDLFSVPWEAEKISCDLDDLENDDDEYEVDDDFEDFRETRFDDEEWQRYVADDDTDDEDDEYTFGDFDEDRFV
jgi:HEAT repeat protein